jgi:DnaJ-class molecular chaperone
MPYNEEKYKDINFKPKHSIPVPPTICPYCLGKGYHETGEDTNECRICKGSGRSVE